MTKSLVLIADIEASKKVTEASRGPLQDKLQQILDELNRENDTLISPYTITLGDEFQAVFKEASSLFTDIWKIVAELHPVRIRFSVGAGDIITPINTKQAIGMDGPAFHKAREGMDRLKESDFLLNLCLDDYDEGVLDIINGSLQLISQQMRGWKKRRFSILYLLSKGFGYKTVTKELGISQAAFYKNKEAGSLDLIQQLSNDISRYINQKLE